MVELDPTTQSAFRNARMSSAGLIRRQLPFALRELDTDNDSVFIE